MDQLKKVYFILFSLIVAIINAQPTYVSSQTKGQNGSSGISWTHTISAGSNRLIIVGVSAQDKPITTATIAVPSGTSTVVSNLTLIGTVTRNSMVTALYYSLAPPVGTVTLGIRPSGGTDLYAGSAYYTDVDQTTPFCGTFTASGTSRFPAITTTCTAGDFVVATLGEIAAPVSADGAGQTRLWNLGSTHYNTYTHKIATTPATMSHTINASKDWGMVAAYMGTTALLPIELLNFNVNQKNEYVEINWSTATELGNDYFTVEKSIDAINFTDLQIVKSKAIDGNSLNKLGYTIFDDKPNEDIVYYRLKQTDYNKNEKHFQIVAFEKNPLHKNVRLNIYPNPNNGNFTIDYDGLASNYTVNVLLTNTIGELVYSTSFNSTINPESINIVSKDHLSSGIYYCTLVIEDIKYVTKFTIE